MRMKEVLYVPSLKKKLLSISTLDKKGYRVAFIDGQLLMWPVAAFHTPGGDVAEIFKPLGVSLGASLESRLSPCS